MRTVGACCADAPDVKAIDVNATDVNATDDRANDVATDSAASDDTTRGIRDETLDMIYLLGVANDRANSNTTSGPVFQARAGLRFRLLRHIGGVRPSRPTLTRLVS
jgi:hypothetical protein